MASIGLYDWDMNFYYHVPPNLELMKTSAYYKQKYILTSMATTFSPEKFTEFIVRKDYDDLIYPNELFLPNVKRGGHAFSGPQYKPMAEDIEVMQPDTYCYEKLAPVFCSTHQFTEMFKTFMNAQHLRLSLDGKTIWPQHDKTLNRKRPVCFFFHDYDLNAINNSHECIMDYVKSRKYQTYIGTKFPIQVSSPADLYKWSSFKIMYKNYSIQYNGVMPDDVFVHWLELQNHTTMSTQLHYNVTVGCSSEDEFSKERLPKIFNQVIYSWNHRYKILLKYEENFFIHKEWKRFLVFLNKSLNDETFNKAEDRQRPLFRYAQKAPLYNRYKQDIFDIYELRELFQFIRQENYDVFKDLYEKTSVTLKGGELVDDTARNKK